MSKFGYLGYDPCFRKFGFFRDKILNFVNRSVSVRVCVVESFGCSLHVCNFDGTCKDCPNKVCSMVTY